MRMIEQYFLLILVWSLSVVSGGIDAALFLRVAHIFEPDYSVVLLVGSLSVASRAFINGGVIILGGGLLHNL